MRALQAYKFAQTYVADPSGGGGKRFAPAYVFMFIEAMADAAVLGDARAPGL